MKTSSWLMACAMITCGLSLAQFSSAALVNQITQDEITWHFDKPYECGQFANGDYWVVGPVTLTRIEPDYQTYDFWEYTTSKSKGVVLKRINGWQVNPSPIGNQGFDETNYNFDPALVPNFPYRADPGQSIVKAVSGTNPSHLANFPVADNRMTGASPLETAAVLTVVVSVPPDNGSTVFRPPYVGTDKTSYSIRNLQTQLLPTFAPVANTPTLSSMFEKFRRVQLDHYVGTGNGGPGSIMRPRLNMASTYQPHNSIRNADAVLRLMLNDPLNEKMPLLIAFIQYGIDTYHSLINGQVWATGYGVQPGIKLPLVFAATLLNNPAMIETAKNTTFFNEHTYVHPGKSGLGIWGGTVSEGAYWNVIMTPHRNHEPSDPYGYIDGGMSGVNISGAYQNCCISQSFKGFGLANFLIPELQPVWNQDYFHSYADRWVEHGVIAQPDPCAPAEGSWSGGPRNGQRCTSAQDLIVGDEAVCVIDTSKYGVTFGPKPESGGNCHLTQSCQCIEDTDPSDGIGRYPTRDKLHKNAGGYGSKFVTAMWDAYRNRVPVEVPVISPAGGSFSGFTDVSLKSKSYGVEIRYTLDGTNPTSTSLLYTKPFRLFNSATVRAKSFHPSNLPSVTTPNAVFTIRADTTQPLLEKIITLDDPTLVTLVFNENLDKASAENPASYSMNQGMRVLSAALSKSEKVVTLKTSAMTIGQAYRITVTGVTDIFLNQIAAGTEKEFTFHNFNPATGLRGLWNFNNDPTGLALDYSPFLHHGIVTGGTWGPGRFGKSLLFKNGDRVLIGNGGNNFGIDATNEFTVSFWLKVTGHTQPNDEIFGRDSRPLSVFVTSAGKISSAIWNGGTLTSNRIVADQAWTHVALTYGVTGRTLYIDGIRDEAGSSDTNSVDLYWPNIREMFMGKTFVGELDEVRLYNRELTVSQIGVLMTYVDIPGDLPVPPSSGSGDPKVPGGTDVDEGIDSETKFLPFKNIFNPLKDGPMAIRFIASPEAFSLTVYDRRGQLVKTLDTGISESEGYLFTWDGRNSSGDIVSSGMYLLVLKSGEKIQNKKVVVVK